MQFKFPARNLVEGLLEGMVHPALQPLHSEEVGGLDLEHVVVVRHAFGRLQPSLKGRAWELQLEIPQHCPPNLTGRRLTHESAPSPVAAPTLSPSSLLTSMAPSLHEVQRPAISKSFRFPVLRPSALKKGNRTPRDINALIENRRAGLGTWGHGLALIRPVPFDT